jgi:hypothetical protein
LPICSKVLWLEGGSCCLTGLSSSTSFLIWSNIAASAEVTSNGFETNNPFSSLKMHQPWSH